MLYDRGGHAAVAFGALADWPVERLAGADLGRPGRGDGGQVVAEDVGGAAAVGAVHDLDRRGRQGDAGVEGGDGRVVPAGDLAEEDPGEHRAGQVQPGTGRQAQVVGDAVAAQVDGHLGDGSALGGGLLGRGHRHVGGAEVDLLRADRGDARAAAHHGVADGHAGVLLLVVGEGDGEERRVERRTGPDEGGPMAAGAAAGHGQRSRGARGGRAGASADGEQDDGGSGGPDGGVRGVAGPEAGPCVVP